MISIRRQVFLVEIEKMEDVDQASEDGPETVSVEMQAADENPWPHLNECFTFTSKRGNSFVMQCQMCLPKVTQLAAFNNSTSNLRKHVLVSSLHKVFS